MVHAIMGLCAVRFGAAVDSHDRMDHVTIDLATNG
jgi:hypothetical protein